MERNRLLGSVTGREVSISENLNIKPLVWLGNEIRNGRKETVMNDSWIYVNMPKFGNISINVPRSQYCSKTYMSTTSISKHVGHANMTTNLQKFIVEVSSKLVFFKDGVTYKVLLKKTKKGWDIDCVKPYWLITHSPNIYADKIPCRYKKVTFLPDTAISSWAHNLIVDLKIAFNYEG